LTHRWSSESTVGQIYVPWINWLLMVSVLILVFAFRSSAALGYAYGMAVITTITITTLLFFYLARTHYRAPLWVVAAAPVRWWPSTCCSWRRTSPSWCTGLGCRCSSA
jgi:K+ transporter